MVCGHECSENTSRECKAERIRKRHRMTALESRGLFPEGRIMVIADDDADIRKCLNGIFSHRFFASAEVKVVHFRQVENMGVTGAARHQARSS